MRLNKIPIIQALNINKRANLIALLNINHILNSASLRRLIAFRNIIYLQPINLSAFGKEHHRRVHRCGMNIFDEVLITRSRALSTNTTAALLTELRESGTLNISEMGNGNYHIIIGIHIFGVELRSHRNDLRTAFICIFLLNFKQFFFD